MAAVSNVSFRLFKRIRASIAFYPALITVFFVLLAAAVLSFETTSTAASLREFMPPGLSDPENGRLILGTLITSIVSLTVFSFSMVMVVLNGAAARLTPRVLPGLISDTRNRVILGFYLGSVVYYLVLLSTITAKPLGQPSVGLLLALVMGGISLALFVVFIRSVSQSIQVDWILSRLFEDAQANLERRIARVAAVPGMPDDSGWWCLAAVRPGYLRAVNERQLGELLGRRNLRAMVQVVPGFFLVAGHPLIKCSEPLTDEERAEVLDCFDFSDEEFAGNNVSYGMRQITEIAVKAISPSINDPGSATRAANLLGVLLQRLGSVPPFDVGCFDDGKPRLFYPQLSMQRLLEQVIAPIRAYASHDPLVIVALVQCMKNAMHDSPREDQIAAIHEEIRALRDQADAELKSWRDRETVNDALQRLEKLERPNRLYVQPLATDRPHHGA